MLSAERTAKTLLIALGITLAQLAFVMAFARHDAQSLLVKYLSLWQHDSQWYAHILEYGYRVNRYPFLAPGNNMAHIGFFPGYSAFSSFIRAISRLETKPAMLLTSQLFTVGAWAYFLLLLQRLRIRPLLGFAAILSIFCFPSGFYLVAAYSESLFIFMLLGFLYWMTSDTKNGWWLAALHGFFMSSTRIVGIPLMLIPVLWIVLETMPKLRLDKKMLFISVSTFLGAALFFLYSQIELGSWNAYSQAQAIGWGVRPNYAAVLDFSIYRIYWPAISWDGFVSSDDISRVSVPIMLIAFCLILAAELSAATQKRYREHMHFRILCYASCAFLLFITVSGLWSRRMISVVRYMLPVAVLLSICCASLLSESDVFKSKWMKRLGIALFAFVLAVFTFVQAGHIDLFSFGIWIA